MFVKAEYEPIISEDMWQKAEEIRESMQMPFFDIVNIRLLDKSETVCKPFKKHHDEQLKLVSTFDWIDFDALSDVKDLIVDMLSEEKAKVYMDDVRTNMIATLTERRIRNLENLAMLADRVQVIDNDDEVGKNVAADYGPKLSV